MSRNVGPSITQSGCHTGACLSLQGNGAYGFTIQQPLTITPGATYTVEVWTKQLKANNCAVKVLFSGVAQTSFIPSTTWALTAFSVTAPQATSYLIQISATCATPENMYIDDTAMYTNGS
jgi:hypothetical protein